MENVLVCILLAIFMSAVIFNETILTLLLSVAGAGAQARWTVGTTNRNTSEHLFRGRRRLKVLHQNRAALSKKYVVSQLKDILYKV
ncbi:hypothetical protein EVAR_43695_1 [Eumeta japonica]|uniref:Uncharacterized protein n=1 Tax=Eumeta variegata TaxID=151549 RepID=A0A4C1WYB1_EUMVA|nr:hypothetical protein EVAR_43695_1 [Eumeta japonica]